MEGEGRETTHLQIERLIAEALPGVVGVANLAFQKSFHNSLDGELLEESLLEGFGIMHFGRAFREFTEPRIDGVLGLPGPDVDTLDAVADGRPAVRDNPHIRETDAL